MSIRVIARDSRLSLLQVQEVMSQYPEFDYTLETVSSYGDKNLQISLLDGEAPADMFTRELDNAIIEGRADIAIHSAKDLPYPLPAQIEVIALLAPFDQTDSLVSRDGSKLSSLAARSTVGTSSPMRKKELLALRPDLNVVPIRGCIEQRVEQVTSGVLDAAIVATCALKRLRLEHHIAEVLPFETHPLQGYLAITALKGRTDLRVRFDRHDVLHKQGEVTLVGFGPGDPELLTVKAVKVLQQADIIFYDALTNEDYLNSLDAEKVYVGKRCAHHHAEQEEINRMLLSAAREGKRVVRLKGGDPMIFAHAGEEIEYLQACLVNVSVVPGITTASAMAADLKTSLTVNGISSSVAIVNGHSKTGIVPETDTIVYYMGASQLTEIKNKLLAAGWRSNTPVTLVHNVSLRDERVFEETLSNIDKQEYPTPLAVLIGDVNAMRHTSRSNIKRTLYTGTACSNPDYLHTPMIEIEPVAYDLPDLRQYDYILFTSRYAVRAFHKHLHTSWQDNEHRIEIVSIGATTTAALKDEGIVDVVQVEQEDSYGVIDYFRTMDSHKRILIPRSNKALPIIPVGLRKLGFEVETLTVYNNVYPRNVRKVNIANIQRVVFTSPSTIDNFIFTYGELPPHIEYVTRGAITEEYLKSRQDEKIQRFKKRSDYT